MSTKVYQQTITCLDASFFRLAFGFDVVEFNCFASFGWIKKYIDPQFHFTYYGFQWETFGKLYLFTFIIAAAALFVALGFKYKLAILTFFLSFTYIELMDKTTI
jgi:hypothetical protein